MFSKIVEIFVALVVALSGAFLGSGLLHLILHDGWSLAESASIPISLLFGFAIFITLLTWLLDASETGWFSYKPATRKSAAEKTNQASNVASKTRNKKAQHSSIHVDPKSANTKVEVKPQALGLKVGLEETLPQKVDDQEQDTPPLEVERHIIFKGSYITITRIKPLHRAVGLEVYK